MIADFVDLKNESWETPEQVLSTVRALIKSTYTEDPEFVSGPRLRVTVTVEPIEDLQ